MDNNVHPFKLAQHFTYNGRGAFGRGNVSLDEMSGGMFRGRRPGGNDDGRAALQKPIGYGLAGALGAAGHQDAFAGEFLRITRGNE